MAARRGKSQARRSGQRGTPAWIWLVVGVVLGLGLSAFLLLRDGWSPRDLMPQPDPTAKAPTVKDEPVAQRPEPAKRSYDFYTVLAEREVAIPDQELANRARDEREKASEPATPLEGRYLLQAGAFRQPGDADALKAKLALLGLIARVEVSQIDGNTWHRVRLGPYASASELEAAKRSLGDNGIAAIALRAN
jgi:cell division protein FtsN